VQAQQAVAAIPALFAATNADDLVLLVGWQANRKLSFRQIVVGQLLGMAALVGVSFVVGVGAARLPQGAVRLLGIVPLLLGLNKVRDVVRRGGLAATTGPVAGGGALSIAFVTISGGADNVAAYVPVFAMGGPSSFWCVAVVFAAMTVLWCVVARVLVRHRGVASLLERAGPWPLPALLIALGIVVLVRSG
jgi:cadmium resistance protein CadD (predicted permease)